MRIEITQADIDNGVKYDCEHCAVALAFKRSPYGDQFCGIGPEHLVLSMACPSPIIPLPENVKEFIEAFDHGEPVKPFSFEMPDVEMPA